MQKSKSEIVTELKIAFQEVIAFCHNLSEEEFFEDKELKWTIAENIHHLVLSTTPLVKALKLPKLVILTIGGKGPGSSVSYEEIIKTYQEKLEAGGKATGKYIPKGSEKATREKSLTKLHSEGEQLIRALENWNEKQLNSYLLPHPLIGKITVREMLYFTIYHTYHHLKAIKQS